jgi:hypothetical protein
MFIKKECYHFLITMKLKDKILEYSTRASKFLNSSKKALVLTLGLLANNSNTFSIYHPEGPRESYVKNFSIENIKDMREQYEKIRQKIKNSENKYDFENVITNTYDKIKNQNIDPRQALEQTLEEFESDELIGNSLTGFRKKQSLFFKDGFKVNDYLKVVETAYKLIPVFAESLELYLDDLNKQDQDNSNVKVSENHINEFYNGIMNSLYSSFGTKEDNMFGSNTYNFVTGHVKDFYKEPVFKFSNLKFEDIEEKSDKSGESFLMAHIIQELTDIVYGESIKLVYENEKDKLKELANRQKDYGFKELSSILPKEEVIQFVKITPVQSSQSVKVSPVNTQVQEDVSYLLGNPQNPVNQFIPQSNSNALILTELKEIKDTVKTLEYTTIQNQDMIQNNLKLINQNQGAMILSGELTAENTRGIQTVQAAAVVSGEVIAENTRGLETVQGVVIQSGQRPKKTKPKTHIPIEVPPKRKSRRNSRRNTCIYPEKFINHPKKKQILEIMKDDYNLGNKRGDILRKDFQFPDGYLDAYKMICDKPKPSLVQAKSFLYNLSKK